MDTAWKPLVLVALTLVLFLILFKAKPTNAEHYTSHPAGEHDDCDCPDDCDWDGDATDDCDHPHKSKKDPEKHCHSKKHEEKDRHPPKKHEEKSHQPKKHEEKDRHPHKSKKDPEKHCHSKKHEEKDRHPPKKHDDKQDHFHSEKPRRPEHYSGAGNEASLRHVTESYKEVCRKTPGAATVHFLQEQYLALGAEGFDALLRKLCGKPSAGPKYVRPSVDRLRVCEKAAESETLLSRLQLRRNTDDLGDTCRRSREPDASLAQFDGRLRPEFKWSVPQKQPPVCLMPKKGEVCRVCPQQEQTALLGTLL
jgi:hypothetical protein